MPTLLCEHHSWMSKAGMHTARRQFGAAGLLFRKALGHRSTAANSTRNETPAGGRRQPPGFSAENGPHHRGGLARRLTPAAHLAQFGIERSLSAASVPVAGNAVFECFLVLRKAPADAVSRLRD